MRYFMFCFHSDLFLLLQISDLFYIPDQWPKPTYDFNKNSLTEAKIYLGRVLFYDPILSADGTISCASCHSPYSAFAHTDHDLSHGIQDSIGNRNAPALMNLAWQPVFMWDGSVNHLDVQALAPLSHPDEMASSIDSVVHRLKEKLLYQKLFLEAFGDSNITGENTLKAMSQFMLTLISAEAKYDRVMRQKDTFTVMEANGYRLFKIHCGSCHKEPLFTTHEFANNGLPIDSLLQDFGRSKVTLDKKDELKFKIPTLRNIEYTYPYMHDGRFKKLSNVLNHYAKGIKDSPTLAKELQQPILLTSNEKVDITAFLLTLSDKNFVFNKKYQYPKEIQE
ncbi:MAG: cytochrome-c peroxidase [Saprospiraceae bacterium]|nr:cytochrome-c peroxidase [Saprospiraceae bacterium]